MDSPRPPILATSNHSELPEFDSKRLDFNRRLRHHGEGSNPHQSVHLNVRRDQALNDSFRCLFFRSKEEWKGKLNINFSGEETSNVEVVLHEWISAIACQAFDPGYALFRLGASEQPALYPCAFSGFNDEHLMFFEFIGSLVGKALYEGIPLEYHFSKIIYSRILGKPISLEDVKCLDVGLYHSLVSILDTEITDGASETFSIESDNHGGVLTIDLVEDGRNVVVTEQNKHEYVRLMIEYTLIKPVEEQLNSLLAGLSAIVPTRYLLYFDEHELDILVSGTSWASPISETAKHDYSAEIVNERRE